MAEIATRQACVARIFLERLAKKALRAAAPFVK